MKACLLVVIIGLFCSTANANGFAGALHFGLATGGEDAASLNKQLADRGIIATATTSGDIRTAWQASISYGFLDRWGVELAYVDLGEATINFGGIDQDINDILDKIGDNHPRSAQGNKLSLTYRGELSKALKLQAKLGVFDWETDYTFSGVTDTGVPVSRDVSLSGNDVSLGLGLVNKLSNDLSAHLDWDFYTIDSEVINVFSFGLSYTFFR